MPGVKVQGLKERWPMGAAAVSNNRLNFARGCALTVEDFLDFVSDVLSAFGMGNHETGGAGVEGGRQADFVMLGDAADDHRLSLGVMLRSMDAARRVRTFKFPSRGDS
jgi:hypothetical protein